MTSPDLTPSDIHDVAFAKPAIGSRGYDESQVDAFLDRAEKALAAGQPLSALVRDARFAKPPLGKRGYDVQQVDDFLDRVASAGHGPGPSAPPAQVVPLAQVVPPAPFVSSTVPGSAVTESPFVQERPGVLARLFGRR